MELTVNPSNVEDYRVFLAVKRLPHYLIRGRQLSFPDEYADRLHLQASQAESIDYEPPNWMFDYQKAVSKIAIRKRKYALFWDCIAAETMIATPNGEQSVEELAEHGGPFEVLSATNAGVVRATAACAWINGYGKLYRFTLASGRSVIATMRHRFLTLGGWKRAGSLVLGEDLVVSASVRQASIAEPCQSIHAADDQRLQRRLPSCLSHYFACSRRYDGRLHSALNSGRDATPQPVGALAHIHSLWRAGDLGGESSHTHPHRHIGRPSMSHCGFHVVPIAVASECQPRSSASASRYENSGSAQPASILTSHPPQVDESYSVEESHFAAAPSYALSLDTLVDVEYVRNDDIYDVHIPQYENYFANGICSHNCGLGKTAVFFEFARVARKQLKKNNRGVLIVSPLNVIRQTIAESEKFYGTGGLGIEQVSAAKLGDWLSKCGGRIGITNYEALTDELRQRRLGALILDESSYLKSHYGKWGQVLLRLGAGLEWKMCCTGTPAPNDRIEFANHAVFLDAFRNVNAFLATFFVNRGQTQNRWELKSHALRPFYRALSHWCIFLTDPRTYGWHDNTESIPPIHVHIEHVPMTSEQQQLVWRKTGELFSNRMGGITHRSTMGQIGKGFYRGEKIASNKPEYVRDRINEWIDDESTIVWCLYNQEQDMLARLLPRSESITGSTPYEERMEYIDAFKSGQVRTLITKPRILGFGLNLQIATRQVFSGLQDSFESFYQAVKRSNRYGSTKPLNVHIPITDVEEPMVQNVLNKAHRVQADAEEQERLFKEIAENKTE